MKAWPYRQECRDHGPTKKNLFLLVELARWQGVQTQSVNGQSAMQTSLDMNSSRKGEKVKQTPQAIAVLNSRINH